MAPNPKIKKILVMLDPKTLPMTISDDPMATETSDDISSGHDVPIREVRLSAGAEFVVVVCGEIMTMPGLPRVPAAEAIGLDENNEITGLF